MWLTVVDDDGQPIRTVEVIGEAFTIGRNDDCGLALDDPKVSREHATIAPGVGPKRALRDLGSANGTLVNGQPIKPVIGFTGGGERVAEISGGDVLQFGDSVVVATLSDPSHDAPPSETDGT